MVAAEWPDRKDQGLDMRKRHHDGERGAALIEFAISAVLLLTLVFGIVEAGWALSNQLDLRHAAREGARVAAVGADNTTIVNTTCAAIKAGDLRDNATITITGGTAIGETVTVRVQSPSTGLTGFLPVFNSLNLDDRAIIYLEQDPNFGAGGPC